MRRHSRMVLILVVMSVIGVAALGLVANRYRSFTELKSVENVQPVSDAPEEAASTPADLSVEERLQIFATARSAVRKVFMSHDRAREVLVRDLRGEDIELAADPRFTLTLLEIHLARKNVLKTAGMSSSEYLAIRDQFRAWKSGDGELIPEWRESFESHPELMEQSDLGDYELLDFMPEDGGISEVN